MLDIGQIVVILPNGGVGVLPLLKFASVSDWLFPSRYVRLNNARCVDLSDRVLCEPLRFVIDPD